MTLAPMLNGLKSINGKLKFAVWKMRVKSLVSEQPGNDDSYSPESIQSYSETDFSRKSTWAILCEEVLDTTFPRAYFQKARDELHRRGIGDSEMIEMRHFVWLTAGWMNFERMVWDWVNLDEKHICEAIEWQHSDGIISSKDREKKLAYLRRYSGAFVRHE